MSDEPWSDWYSVPDLAPRLGVSVATLKRRLTDWSRDGRPIVLPGGRSVEIQAEKISRPQGDEWRVRVRGALADQSTDPERIDSKATPPTSSAQGDAQALTRVLDTIGGLVTDVRALERENGTLKAERDAARLAADAARELAAEVARQRDDIAARLKDAEAERDAERAKSWWDKLRGR